jgi:hypothetical protein
MIVCGTHALNELPLIKNQWLVPAILIVVNRI